VMNWCSDLSKGQLHVRVFKKGKEFAVRPGKKRKPYL
jgi:hypothetical protein